MVSRIEKVVGGVIVQRAERAAGGPYKGRYVCLASGSNTEATGLDTLDDVASFLRGNPGSGVRMQPGWAKICDDIFIDGAPR